MPDQAKRKFLTDPEKFQDVSRGNPKPFTLKGDDLVKARLTPETWRLEIVSDGTAQIAKPRKLDDGTAIDLPVLMELGKTHGVKFLKAMQCSNIAQPLGQGLWEGVPLREVLKLAGKISNIRRLYYHGFHSALFQAGSSSSSLPWAPASARSQYSTRFRPDQPTIATPCSGIGSPCLNLSGPSSMRAIVLRYESMSLLPLA